MSGYNRLIPLLDQYRQLPVKNPVRPSPPAFVDKDRDDSKVVLTDGKVSNQMFTDFVQPLLRVRSQRGGKSHPV